jgi:hypothetical protein
MDGNTWSSTRKRRKARTRGLVERGIETKGVLVSIVSRSEQYHIIQYNATVTSRRKTNDVQSFSRR